MERLEQIGEKFDRFVEAVERDQALCVRSVSWHGGIAIAGYIAIALILLISQYRHIWLTARLFSFYSVPHRIDICRQVWNEYARQTWN
ncbi:MAG: hypothetical protein QXW44_07605 [Pyrobaculum sp.]